MCRFFGNEHQRSICLVQSPTVQGHPLRLPPAGHRQHPGIAAACFAKAPFGCETRRNPSVLCYPIPSCAILSCIHFYPILPYVSLFHLSLSPHFYRSMYVSICLSLCPASHPSISLSSSLSISTSTFASASLLSVFLSLDSLDRHTARQSDS